MSRMNIKSIAAVLSIGMMAISLTLVAPDAQAMAIQVYEFKGETQEYIQDGVYSVTLPADWTIVDEQDADEYAEKMEMYPEVNKDLQDRQDADYVFISTPQGDILNILSVKVDSYLNAKELGLKYHDALTSIELYGSDETMDDEGAALIGTNEYYRVEYHWEQDYMGMADETDAICVEDYLIVLFYDKKGATEFDYDTRYTLDTVLSTLRMAD